MEGFNLADISILLSLVVGIATVWSFINVKINSIEQDIHYMKTIYQKEHSQCANDIQKIYNKLSHLSQDISGIKAKLEIADCYQGKLKL